MEPFRVHILGCGSATPTLKHEPSAQLVEVRGKMFLVDCAEGTQTRLRHAHVHFSAINHIFITHLHGDHCLGLFGLLSTFGLLGRTAPMYIYATGELRAALDVFMSVFCSNLGYEVIFKPIDTTVSAVIYEDRSLTVTTLPLEHRVPCCGFLFREKPTRSTSYVRSYAYCSDTRYMPDLHHLIHGVSTLYHESTYGTDKQHNADTYGHSTARDAAMVARDAEAGKLVLGHFSARYEDETVLLDEAQAIFPNTILADEGMVIDV